MVELECGEVRAGDYRYKIVVLTETLSTKKIEEKHDAHFFFYKERIDSFLTEDGLCLGYLEEPEEIYAAYHWHDTSVFVTYEHYYEGPPRYGLSRLSMRIASEREPSDTVERLRGLMFSLVADYA